MAVPPLYLFLGQEIGERNDEIQKIKASLKKKVGELDEYKFYATETKIQEVVNLLLNESLFASARFIVFYGAELLKKKEDLEVLTGWIKSATPSSVLILVSEENSCDKKLENLIPKENKKIFWEMFENRKEQWLFDFFKKNSYSLTDEANSLILDMIENNTESLKTECSRFFLCFEKGYTITAEDVEKILSHNREESAFTLFDSLCQGDKRPNVRLESSLDILQKIRLSKDSNSVQLIAGFTYCFRRLQVWHGLLAEKEFPSDLDYKIKGFASKKAQKQYRSAAKLWSLNDTDVILAALASADMEIRSGGSPIEDIVLQKLLYSIVYKKGRKLEQWEEPPF